MKIYRGALLLFVLLLSSQTRSNETINSNLPVADRTVRAIVKSGGTIYLGGEFTSIGARTGGGVPIDAATGALIAGFPEVGGSVFAIAPDGSGGWYIGGLFVCVDGVPRENLAHILPDKSLDLAWNPGATEPTFGFVQDVYVSGGVVYVGGVFTNVAGSPRNNAAAVDATTGSILPWNPNPNGEVYKFELSGGVVFMGGWFSAVGGTTRNGVAAVDATTGALQAWNPNPAAGAQVMEIALSGSSLYVGGNFTSVGGFTRNRAFAADTTTGSVLPWNPNASNQVNALAVSGTSVYMGGVFTQVGGVGRRLAAVDATTGALLPWDPLMGGTVQDITISGGTLYAGGQFQDIAGTGREYLAAIDTGTASVLPWDPHPNGSVYRIVVSGSTVFAGGYFTSLGAVDRNGLAAIDSSTGALLAWNPDVEVGGKIETMVESGGTIYVGGEFSNIGGLSREGLAAIDASTGSILPWNPNVQDTLPAVATVDSIKLVGGTLFVGGSFDKVGGLGRNNLAAVDLATGSVLAWNPNANSWVAALEYDGVNIFAGGNFTLIGGLGRNRLASIDAASGAINAWNPNSNSRVRALKYSAGTLYAGGQFTNVGGLARGRLAAIDSSTGAVLPWNPNADSWVYTLNISGDRLYAGGSFDNVGGLSRSRIAAIDATTAAVLAWDPDAKYNWEGVKSLLIDQNTLYAGGYFRVMSCKASGFIAGIEDPALVTPTVTPTNSATPFPTMTPTPSSTSTPSLTSTYTPFSTATPAVIGTDWIEATASAAFSPRHHQSSLVFNSKMWVIGGYDFSYKNDVWSSVDGVNWIQETPAAAFSIRSNHTNLVFNSKMWVIGGFDSGVSKNDIWSSVDGVTWIQESPAAAFTERYGHDSVVFNGKMWVIGGYDEIVGRKKDVWSSVDGVTWIQETPAAAWWQRLDHTCLVFNSKIWVIAGNRAGPYRDIWSSVDGVNWVEETPAAAFPARYQHTSLVFNSKMWVIGGSNGSSRLNDVWSSVDGVNWVEETPAAAFWRRPGHSSVVFNSKMWVIGGNSGAFEDDVWYSPPGSTATPTSTSTNTPYPTGTPTVTPTITVTMTPSDPTPPNFTGITPGGGGYFTSSDGVVCFTTSEDLSSGTVTLVRVGGTADPGSPRVYILSGSELLAGAQCVTVPGCVSGTIYDIQIQGCDLYPNCSSPTVVSGVNCDYTDPAVTTLNWSDNQIIGATDITVNWTNSENLSSCKISVVRIGGAADPGAPHVYTASGSELLSGAQSINISGLVDGCQYNLVIEQCDLAGNCSTTTRYGLKCDVSPPVYSGINPGTGGSFSSSTAPITFTVNEDMGSCTVQLVRTGGTADTDSPHVYILSGDELFAGTHVIYIPGCKPGTTYDLIIQGCDLYPNCSSPVIISGVQCLDTELPTFTNISPSPGGTFTSTTGTVNWENSEELSSLDITLNWIGGTVDAGPHAYTCTGSCLTQGSQSTDFTSLVDGAIYEIVFSNGCDLAPNCSAPVTIGPVGCNTGAAPVFDVGNPTDNFFFNTTGLTIDYSVSEQLSSGDVTLEWTGGVSDPGAPYVHPFAGTELDPGSQSYTFSGLVDGAQYQVIIQGCDLAPNCSAPITIIGLNYDLTPPQITGVTPSADATFGSTSLTVDWTNSEDMSNCQLVLERVDGPADPGSPHIYNVSGGELNAGAQSHIFAGLIDGAVYKLTIYCCDKAGNCVVGSVVTNLTCDTTPPDFEPITPPQDGSFDPDSVTVTWVNSEDLSNLTVSLVWTGGVFDGTTRDLVCSGNRLNQGAQSFTFTGCIPGAIYKLVYSGCDKAPNCVVIEHLNILCRPYTLTPTPTVTQTNTPTASPTFTDTNSPTFTPSPTHTPTVSETDTFTPTPTPSITLTYTPTFTDTGTYTFTPTPSPSNTPSNTFTYTSIPTSTPTPTVSPTFTFSPTIPCETIAPELTVKAIVDPEVRDIITINVYSDEPIDCSTAYLVIVPHSYPKAPITISGLSNVDPTTCEGMYSRYNKTSSGFGDVDTITAYAVDPCGNWGASDGSFERVVINDKLVLILHNRIDPSGRGDETTIQYQLSASGPVEIKIFNSLGELIRTLVDETSESGKFQVKWDGRNEQGQIVASDIYFVTVISNEFSVSEKILVIK